MESGEDAAFLDGDPKTTSRELIVVQASAAKKRCGRERRWQLKRHSDDRALGDLAARLLNERSERHSDIDLRAQVTWDFVLDLHAAAKRNQRLKIADAGSTKLGPLMAALAKSPPIKNGGLESRSGSDARQEGLTLIQADNEVPTPDFGCASIYTVMSRRPPRSSWNPWLRGSAFRPQEWCVFREPVPRMRPTLTLADLQYSSPSVRKHRHIFGWRANSAARNCPGSKSFSCTKASESARPEGKQSEILIGLTSHIVAACVGGENVRPEELPELIQNIHAALMKLG